MPGGIAGAIGMGIGDLLDPTYVLYAPKTFFLKFMIGLIAGLLAHKVFHIEEKSGKALVWGVVLSTAGGMLFNVIAEPLVGYLYTTIFFGASAQAAKALASWNFITTSVNAILAVVIASLLYLALVPSLKKSGTLKKLARA